MYFMDSSAISILVNSTKALATKIEESREDFLLFAPDAKASIPPQHFEVPLEYRSVTRKFWYRDTVIVVTIGMNEQGNPCELTISSATLERALLISLQEWASAISIGLQHNISASTYLLSAEPFTLHLEIKADDIHTLLELVKQWLVVKFDTLKQVQLDTISKS